MTKEAKKEYLAHISQSLKIQFLLLITNMTEIHSPATSAPFRFLHFKVTLLFSPQTVPEQTSLFISLYSMQLSKNFTAAMTVAYF